MIGRPIATMMFGDLMFASTEKGVFWWDDKTAAWRKLVKGEVVTPANEATSDDMSLTIAPPVVIFDDEPLADKDDKALV